MIQNRWACLDEALDKPSIDVANKKPANPASKSKAWRAKSG
jgi:hypothetical protein